MICNPAALVLVPFPYADLQTAKREAVVKTFGEVTPTFMSRLLDGLCGRVGYRIAAGKPR
jgi:hypothetical protein